MKNKTFSASPAYHDSPSLWRDLLKQGLKDDGWPWDWTSLGIPERSTGRIRARVVAKSEGVWAAAGLTQALTAAAIEIGGTVNATSELGNGERFKKGETVSRWRGSARELLALERPFLNLAAYASGVATATRRLVDLVEAACPARPPRVTTTRKTLPGYRDLVIHGVLSGGGFAHRVSLSGGVLIKENHVAAAGGIEKAVQAARAIAPHGLRIEIEVRDLKELVRALNAGVDVIMLDNFSPDETRAALKKLPQNGPSRPLIEVSGGLNEGNVAEYAIEGVDILSVGSLSHSVKASDFSLLVG